MRFFLVTLGLLILRTCVNAAFPPQPLLAIQWDNAALQGVRDAKLGAPVVARALAIVHTCMYDAWAAYDERVVGTQLRDALRRPASERTLANKEQAVSYAAYRALLDVLPVDTNSGYIPLMKQLGYAIFPTYSVYSNGVLTATYPQAAVSTFVALDQTYQLLPSQIP